ncbi:beta-lactamase family protein [Paenibacillus sp. TRM 82003]|nr:beta-lactamase family protein [Paenibacillus sp. TRM 82003]
MDQGVTQLLSGKGIRSWAGRPNHRLTIGIVADGKRSIVTPGRSDEDKPGEALYEIGSITKTMIGLLLAVGEREKLWSRDDAVSALAPDWASLPFAQQTTLLELVTHTSGLPRLPANLMSTVADKRNPYANYAEEHLVEAVLSERPAQGKKHHLYSNYGFGLLGWLLSKRLDKSLNESLRQYVYSPLRMERTGFGPNSAEAASLVPAFDAKGKPTLHWDFQDATAGAGAVRSTVSDMLTYLEAHLGSNGAGLSAALEECRNPRRALSDRNGAAVGYAWMSYKEKDGSATWWHNGGTYGSSSFASFNREHGAGFVILSNYGVDLWSQLPFLSFGRMTVDRLARGIAHRLFA